MNPASDQRRIRFPFLGYSTRTLAEATGFSEEFIRQQIKEGKLRARRAGRKYSIPVEWAREWYRQLPEAQNASRWARQLIGV